jgi:hypothetical protein
MHKCSHQISFVNNLFVIFSFAEVFLCMLEDYKNEKGVGVITPFSLVMTDYSMSNNFLMMLFPRSVFRL